MKTILCYGDSNTWGWSPSDMNRYPPNVRWPGVLRQLLGEGFSVIEEGLPGRTTVWDDPIEGYKNGATYLPPCLASHAPIDLVVIMLGTNDLKLRFSLPASDIASGIGVLVDIVQRSAAGPQGHAPAVLVIVPPTIAPLPGSENDEAYAGGAEKSRLMARYYRQVAGLRGCAVLDAAEIIAVSPVDGIHLDPEAHAQLGWAVASKCREMLGQQEPD